MTWVRRETFENCTLYLGDALEILPTLDAVSAIVTDPPYKLESGGNSTDAMSGKFSHGNYDNSGNIVVCEIDWTDFMPSLFDVLKPDAHAYVMCNNRHVQAMLNSAQGAGFRFHNLLVWDKRSATPNRWYMKNCEFTGFLFKGSAKFINDCGSRQLVKYPIVKNAPHDTRKPVELMAYYIRNSTQAGDVVLDPFMGAGSTGVACAKLDRGFIGCELIPEHFDEACRRVEAAVSARSGRMSLV